MTTELSRTIFASVLVAGFLPAVAVADPVQWGGNGHWYEAVAVGTTGISWTDAEGAAEAKGGYLATITSAAENAFVYDLAAAVPGLWDHPGSPRGTTGPWLGGYQYDKLDENDGHWAWVTGETWSYTNWNPDLSEPNNLYGIEDYLTFNASDPYGTSPYWNDEALSGAGSPVAPIFGYLIEYDTYRVPEPASLALLGIGAAALLVRRRRSSGLSGSKS